MYYFVAITSHVFFKNTLDQKMEIHGINFVDLIYTYFNFFKNRNPTNHILARTQQSCKGIKMYMP